MTYVPTPTPPKRGDKIMIDGAVWTVLHVGDVDGEERSLVGWRCPNGHLHVMSGIRVGR